MEIKKIALTTGGALLIVGLVFLLIPQERADAISTYIKRSRGDLGMVCLDYYRNNLKDPESAKLINTTFTDSTELQEISIKYKAKNSYGAYITSEEKCTFIDGKLNEKLTDNSKIVEEEINKMDKEIACRKQKMRDVENGNSWGQAESKFAICMAK